MEEKSYTKFLENIYTKSQVADLLDEIEIAKTKIYKGSTSESLSKKIEHKISGVFYDNIRKLEAAGQVPTSSGDQEKYLDSLKDFMLKAPACSLYLAFNPSMGLLKKISEWIETQNSKKILLDIFVSEDVVGGAKIEFAGKYKDYSVGNIVDKLLENPNLDIKK